MSVPLTKKPELNDSQRKMVLDKLLQAIDPDDPPLLTLVRPAMLPVMTKNGFKTVPVQGGQEFLVKSYRFGARDGLIAMAEPIDTQDWEYAEFNAKKLEELFPSRAKSLCAVLGVPDAMDLSAAMHAFVAEQERLEVEMAAKELELFRERNKDNDLWGLF